MAKTTPRLHVPGPFSQGQELPIPAEQAHYLLHVLRMAPGDAVMVFNGQDGEWLAHVAAVAKKSATLRLERCVAAVQLPPDVDYVFAPLKHARLDYMVQKATELGARRLQPVITRRTIAERVNLDRMRANVVEAAEQCNLVFVPEVLEPKSLPQLLASWEQGRTLVFCDEVARDTDPAKVLAKSGLPLAVLVGPEGGFAPEERDLLLRHPAVLPVSLGPRIMRADTAAIAALALVQAVLGDWTRC